MNKHDTVIGYIEYTPINELDFLYWFFYHEIIHISFVDFFMVIRYNT